MSITLNDIEKRLEALIEVHLVKYLPSPRWQDRLARKLSEALRTNIHTGNLHSRLPNRFTLMVNPVTLNQWQEDPRLLEGLTKIFRVATSEAGLEFSVPPTIHLAGTLQIAEDDLEIKAGYEDVAPTQNMPTQSEESAPEEQLPESKVAFLIIGGTKVHTLKQTVTNIGRRLDNHVVVDDPRVSRYHSQVRYVRGKFIIFDLNSTGGTYVNGQRVNQSVLYPGDVISLAGLPIIFGQDNPPQNMKQSGDTGPMLSPQSSERSTAVLKTIPLNDQKPQ